MDTSINQYFIYGIAVPINWYVDWEKETGKNFIKTFDEFIKDDGFSTNPNFSGRIFRIFNGRDGQYIIIGNELYKTDNENPFFEETNPIKVPIISELERINIEYLVKRYFDLTGQFHYYFVTHTNN